jgi:hypothetical protein
MWQIAQTAEFSKRLTRFAKKNRREVLNALDNANAFFEGLCNGLKPQQIIRGFVHPEPMGIKAVDESGPGAHKKAIRLYLFPDEESETLHFLTLGDKSSQKDDIQHCQKFVSDLIAGRASVPKSPASDPKSNESEEHGNEDIQQDQ